MKSRIQYLRELVESDPHSISYDGQSAFDVADMVKQYFRDLPEPIFTSKLCESFLHIYQCKQLREDSSCCEFNFSPHRTSSKERAVFRHIQILFDLIFLFKDQNSCKLFSHFLLADFPKDQQLVAAQAAILLLPDENREALRTLLFFLRDVVACVDENQMTPTNIAVCLAPSLFHLNTLKRDANAAR